MPEKKFEKALEELEKIVQDLEDTELPLDEAMALFEKGIKLSRFCTKKLEEAERKVEMLVRDEKGNLKKTEFDEEE